MTVPETTTETKSPRFTWWLNPESWEHFLQRYNSQIYALVVAFGVPLIAWLIDDFFVNLAIVAGWFGVAPLVYFWTEGREILGQIEKYGLLDQQKSDAQRRTMYALYFGVIGAVVVWIVVVAIYAGNHWPDGDWREKALSIFRAMRDTPLHYGILEWMLLLHTMVVARFTTHILYAIISAFLQATAGQRRLERTVPE